MSLLKFGQRDEVTMFIEAQNNDWLSQRTLDEVMHFLVSQQQVSDAFTMIMSMRKSMEPSMKKSSFKELVGLLIAQNKVIRDFSSYRSSSKSHCRRKTNRLWTKY